MKRTLQELRSIADKTNDDSELGVMVREYLKDGPQNSFIKCFHCGAWIPDIYSVCTQCKKILEYD
jgi:hypothetical protein